VVSLEKLTGRRVRVTLPSGVYVVPSGSVPPGTEEIDEKQLQSLQTHSARSDAQRFLEYSERSTGQLEKKIISLGYPDALAKETVNWAKEYGFVDDVRFSRLFVRSRTMGKARLRVELISRGVEETAVEQFLSGFSEQREFPETVAAVKKKYAGITDREKAFRRAAGWLQRRGFSAEFIHRVLQEAL